MLWFKIENHGCQTGARSRKEETPGERQWHTRTKWVQLLSGCRWRTKQRLLWGNVKHKLVCRHVSILAKNKKKMDSLAFETLLLRNCQGNNQQIYQPEHPPTVDIRGAFEAGIVNRDHDLNCNPCSRIRKLGRSKQSINSDTSSHDFPFPDTRCGTKLWLETV